MSTRTLSGFLDRVRLTLGLVVAYLLVLQGLHFLGQLRAHQRLREELTGRAAVVAETLVSEAGPEAVRSALRAARQRSGQPARPALPQRALDGLGVIAVGLVTADDPLVTGLAPDQARRLAVGETVVDAESALAGDPSYAAVRALRPVLDDGGGVMGALVAEVGAERLALSRRQLLWFMALEAGSLMAFLGGLVFFTRWMLKPLELLDRTARAGEGQDAVSEDLARQDDTGFVIETYRRMVEQLREKEQELRRLRELDRNRADELQDLNASIVDSMVSGVLVLDLSGRVRSVNDAARETLRLGDGRVLGRPCADVLPHLPELNQRLQSCLAEGVVLRRDELRLNLAGVGRRDVGLTLSPLKDRGGQRTGAICLVVDLTEIKRLQEQVRLKESLAELGELSAGIAHEFRNSLATILGFASLVEKRAQGEAVEHAQAIHAEVTALRRVVDDFLRFANPTRLVIETIDLDALFRDLASDVAQRGSGKAVSFRAATGLPRVSGDETLLRRVFTNLLRNAVDAVRDGGHVEVRAETAAGEITLHVDDDGPGVPPEDRERIFTPFFTRKEKGTGLGLALARKIVVHHGGRVVVEASPEGGARFSVTLPLREEAAGQGATLPGNEK